jgi:hypothetical protein
LIYQERCAAGLDREEVQFTRTVSPILYLFFTPLISGPSESGKSVEKSKHKRNKTGARHVITLKSTIHPEIANMLYTNFSAQGEEPFAIVCECLP